MPEWVKALLDEWLRAANLTAGRLFRPVNKNGKAWGEGLTEKAVWHVVREYAHKAGIEMLDLTIYGGHALGCAMQRVANSNRFNSSSGTSPSKRPSGTLAASSAFGLP